MTAAKPLRKVRCAIYTRKSSEEGLEMEFNSLDAQRESCEAYITSQKAEGWVPVPDHYDDGGFSGGNLERPALKRLLADIEAGLIDVVVVYKIDRLSRSLMDFSKLVEVFDRNDVTFVSVTQSFNTTTSMGRLTLNILLSFAQFEREVIGERIRDKFAASRKKGMWMGGVPPLGYDVVARKLVVNEAEADLVRHIFRRFLQVGSATLLVKELNSAGHHTKSWITQDGNERLGAPFTKNFLYKMLENRVYLGEAVHKGVAHPGEHEAIIDRTTWERVEAVKVDNAPRKRAAAARATTPAPLKGLVVCTHCGRAMTPTHTRKKGRLYRYYTCMKAINAGHDTCPVRSIAAGEIEAAVIGQVRALLRAPEIRARAERMAPQLAIADLHAALDRFDAVWDELFPAEQARLLQLLVERVSISPDGADLRLRAEGLASVVADITAQASERSAA
ncbi:putative Site-specific recombinase [Magnetospirillum sp. XM-1]|uniref:recombinase family protein n=1 Tax=Magnetospirillum sp. XM-1 TaxID=1663591 RepID=UPI00073DED4A|nr:recombinase family protein [Magnetospirillum sp. XM-1]CUW37089.1 putative Site-specific recombinase [Magnetospirillum sp. XM-1]